MSRDFWSRRKAAVEAEQAEDLRKVEAQALAERDASLEEQSDAEILQELGLPDPDELSEGDDFKVFLTETVPARIRSRALRRLWLTNPVLANVDGLVDYGEDFTDASCVIENLQTAYQVGKGMTAHVDELARQAEAEAAAEAATEEPEAVPADDASEEPAPATEPDPKIAHSETAVAYEPPEFEETHDDAPLPPRRMRFEFDDAGASA
ncbi:DUF3306 domain-containing protein [Shimia thalassica]|uniref:DUF3306 domain-containing protein n=1 Tax=Shimia thalassica TaxID=1715693 RepID=UPI00249551DA|nr:DUF3306 domain-containing protein [Shimia thalassica]